MEAIQTVEHPSFETVWAALQETDHQMKVTFALKNGFYVLKPSGDTFAVIPPEGIYSPREW